MMEGGAVEGRPIAPLAVVTLFLLHPTICQYPHAVAVVTAAVAAVTAVDAGAAALAVVDPSLVFIREQTKN